MRGRRSTISGSTPSCPRPAEARGDRGAGGPAAANEHGGPRVAIGRRWVALIEPIGPAEVARLGLAMRPPPADLLLLAFELAERRQQRPGARPAVGIRHQ